MEDLADAIILLVAIFGFVALFWILDKAKKENIR